MTIQKRLRSTIRSLDARIADVSLALKGEKKALLSFLFHGLFRDDHEQKSGVLDPQQGVTVEMFKNFIRHFRAQSYRFLSPLDMLRGLPAADKYILLTFDDGYYNNTRALPILEEFGVPAVFFISSDHVKYGKAFWWDVLYRTLRQRGQSEFTYQRTLARYKRLRTAEVESRLRAEYGEGALRPVGDPDRPFSPSELKEFAGHPLVVLGNHTKEHAILSNYFAAEIREQIQGAQDDIRELTGKLPQIISYPNGNCSEQIVRIAKDAGLRLGMVAQPGKNRLPLRQDTTAAMSMKRFMIWANSELESQCRTSRSDMSLYPTLARVKARGQGRLSY